MHLEPSECYFTELQRSRWGTYGTLMGDVREQRHKPCTLYGSREVALRLCGHTGATTVVHTRMRIGVCTQLHDVFVINMIVYR